MIKLLAIIATIIGGGILWHLGGQNIKVARTLVFPSIIAIVKAILISNPLALLYWPALWLMIAGFSYGLSSPIHKFWVWVFKKGSEGNCKIVEIATRATCGLMWSVPAIIFAVLTGKWIIFAIYMALSTIFVTVFGLHKNVKVSEVGTGMTIASSILV